MLIFAGSIGSFYLLPAGFLPAEDSSRLLLAIELPPGSRMDDTRAVTDAIAAQVRERPEVRSVFVNGGRVMGSGAEVRKATLVINLVPKDNRKLTQDQIRLAIGAGLADVPDIRFWFLKDNGQRQLQLVASGRDGAAVTRAAADLTSQAKRIPLLANVVSTAELDRPELRVVPITDVAAELGVSTEAISEAVRIATIGDIGANLAKFDVGDRQVPIRVQLEESARGDRQFLESLKVATTSGAAVPLSAVARFELAQGPTAIDRYDRMRRVVIGADLVGDVALGKAVERVMALPAAKNLPAGVEIKQFGDAEIMGEVFESFAKAMGAGIMMVYAVLVLLFGSFLQPITILFSLPLSIGGAIVALAITGRPISLPVVIGILMLMGIVTKNAIMLVDFAIEEMKQGMSRTRRDRRCGPQARAAHRHDHHRHDRRHAAVRLRRGLGRRVPLADGDCRDRRPDVLDAAVAGVRAGGVRGHGRHRAPRLAALLPFRRPHRGAARTGAGHAADRRPTLGR